MQWHLHASELRQQPQRHRWDAVAGLVTGQPTKVNGLTVHQLGSMTLARMASMLNNHTQTVNRVKAMTDTGRVCLVKKGEVNYDTVLLLPAATTGQPCTLPICQPTPSPHPCTPHMPTADRARRGARGDRHARAV